MKNNLKVILYCFLFLSGCEQIPEPPTLINIEDRTNISIIDAVDSLIIWDTRNIKFNIQTNNQITDSSLTLLNDLEIERYTGNNIHNIIEFNSNNYEDGWYKLKYLLYSHLTSGKNKQYFVDSIAVNIRIDNSDKPFQVNIQKYGLVNGKLQIEWEEYKSYGFQSYNIYKKSKLENPKKVATILESEKNYWRDPYYIGDFFEYYLELNAKNSNINSKVITVNYPAPTLKVKNIDNKMIELKWNKSLFDSAFSKYEIQRNLNSNSYYPGSNVLKSFSHISDTSFKDTSIVFGSIIHYQLYVYNTDSSKFSITNIVASKPDSVFYGFKMPYFRDFYFDPLNNYVFLLSGLNYPYPDYYKIYDAQSMQLVSSHSATPMLSNDCQSAYINLNSYYSTEPMKITSVSPLNLNVIKEYNIQNIIGEEIKQISSICIANNGNIIFTGFTYKQPTFYYHKTFYINIEKGEILATRNDMPHIHYISSSGNYILSNTNVFRYNENSKLEIIRSISTHANYNKYVFFPRRDTLITTDFKQIEIIDLKNNLTLHSYPIEDDLFFPTIEYAENYIGGNVLTTEENNTQYYRIYDLSTGEKIFEVKTNGQIRLADKKMFSMSGYYLPLN